jgi:hypothetical protein
MEDFFEGWIRGRGPEGEGIWDHLLGWWGVRERKDILLLSYRHILRDPAGHIRRLAEFASFPLDKELLDLALEHSSRAYMLANKDRFDDALMRGLSEDLGGLPPGSDSAKVRASTPTHSDELPSALLARMDEIWAEKITPELGFESFAELEATL